MHKIITHIHSKYLINDDNRIYGVRFFDTNVSDCAIKISEDYHFIRVSKKPTAKNVKLVIDLLNRYGENAYLDELNVRVKTGIVIEPMFYYDYASKSYCLNKYIFNENVYIVIFEVKDIVFFDGNAISVSSFAIPSGDYLEYYDKTVYRFMYSFEYECIVDKHNELFNKINAQLMRG